MALTDNIPKDFNDAASKVEGLNELANQYVVAPLAAFGIAGFQFSAFKQYKSELKSQITDNYSEKNIALQDNIVLEPELFSLSGVVGEITYEYKNNKPSQIKQLAQKLTTLVGYLPAISDTLKTLQKSVDTKVEPSQAFADATLASAADLYQTYKKLNPPKTMQAKAYNFFLALRNARVLISFDTPYGFKANYAIMNIITTQPENTETTSDVEIILKEFRYARTSTVPFDAAKFQGRTQPQNQPVVDKGSTQGETTDKKLFGKIIDGIKNFAKGKI